MPRKDWKEIHQNGNSDLAWVLKQWAVFISSLYFSTSLCFFFHKHHYFYIFFKTLFKIKGSKVCVRGWLGASRKEAFLWKKRDLWIFSNYVEIQRGWEEGGLTENLAPGESVGPVTCMSLCVLSISPSGWWLTVQQDWLLGEIPQQWEKPGKTSSLPQLPPSIIFLVPFLDLIQKTFGMAKCPLPKLCPCLWDHGLEVWLCGSRWLGCLRVP